MWKDMLPAQTEKQIQIWTANQRSLHYFKEKRIVGNETTAVPGAGLVHLLVLVQTLSLAQICSITISND